LGAKVVRVAGDAMKKLAQFVGVISALAAIWSSVALAQSSGTRSSGFGYDPASGLLTQEVVEPGTPALRLQTDYVYDAFGNKTSAIVSGIDIVTRSASTTYDAQGRFATSATNALGQSETWQYDPRFGLPTSHTGPNGLTTAWSYDGFGRKILELRADGTRGQFTYAFCSGFNGGTASCPAGAVRLNQANSFAATERPRTRPPSSSISTASSAKWRAIRKASTAASSAAPSSMTARAGC
jgi:YD repeat-containing protein